MTIASEIERISNNIASAYAACESKGATMPQVQNSANLATCINSVSGGSDLPEGIHKVTINVTPSGASLAYKKILGSTEPFYEYPHNEIVGYPGTGCYLYAGKYGYNTKAVSYGSLYELQLVGDSDTVKNLTLTATTKTYWTPTSNKYYIDTGLTVDSGKSYFPSYIFNSKNLFEIFNDNGTDKISRNKYLIDNTEVYFNNETPSKCTPYNPSQAEPSYVIVPSVSSGYLYTSNNHVLTFAPKDYDGGYTTTNIGGDENPLQLYEYDFPNQTLIPILYNNAPVYLYSEASSYEYEEMGNVIYTPDSTYLGYDSMSGSFSLSGGGNLYDGQEVHLYRDYIGNNVYLGDNDTLPLCVYIYGNDVEVTEVTHNGEYDENGNYVGYGEGDYDSSGNYMPPSEYTTTVTKYYGVFRTYDYNTSEWLDVYSLDGKRYCIDCNGDDYSGNSYVHYFDDDYTQPTGQVQFEGGDFYLMAM